MSQKNFASYGDMETLVTEIADKCGPYTEISYEDWLQLTPYQQEHGRWDVTGVPGADGTISIDLMTKLWENPNPTASFAAQNITLANSNYDYLLVLAYSSASNSHILPCLIVKKGKNGSLLHAGNSSTAVSVRYRNLDYLSDTVLSIGNANMFENGSSSWTTGNSFIIPYIIYGIKLHHTVEIKAIAPEVSTLASKCMLSDGETSVEDKLTANNLSDYINIIGYTSDAYEFPSDGYVQLTLSNTSSVGAAVYANVYGNDLSKYFIVRVVGVAGHAGPSQSFFVRKGMKIKITANSNPNNGNSALFIPLT